MDSMEKESSTDNLSNEKMTEGGQQDQNCDNFENCPIHLDKTLYKIFKMFTICFELINKRGC